jgi:hypothetical protein
MRRIPDDKSDKFPWLVSPLLQAFLVGVSMCGHLGNRFINLLDKNHMPNTRLMSARGNNACTSDQPNPQEQWLTILEVPLLQLYQNMNVIMLQNHEVMQQLRWKTWNCHVTSRENQSWPKGGEANSVDYKVVWETNDIYIKIRKDGHGMTLGTFFFSWVIVHP